MIKQIIIGISFLLLFCTILHAGTPMTIQNGQWEITVDSKVRGIDMAMPPMTFKQCINKNDPIPQNNQSDQQCINSKVKTSGNTITWRFECNTPSGKSTGSGQATYEKNKMSGKTTMALEGMQIDNTMKGYRLGECE
ncbi:MAG: DUF3617 family protein [Desulfobacteraceae bacterium]|nr:DUF3617 family protein [Desulfobacteraceae bacterium]